MTNVKVALLCSGLGHILRGHEVFAKDLFALLRDSLDITLFKGGGESSANQVVVDNIHRNDPLLEHVHVLASPKWADSMREQERGRIETTTFAYAVLKPLLKGEFDVIHCLEREICDIIYQNRHLFRNTPRVVFSNGGAIPARYLPKCDFVQEHTELNLAHSAKGKAFLIPHGVDTGRFRPGIKSDFRSRHGIPSDAFLVITVGAISFTHKRTDYVIREVAAVKNAHLLVVGQETKDSPAIRALGDQLMPGRIVFTSLPHDALPEAYAAADVFTLGSQFETFGIVYVEAMAMGLPVISTNHRNQQSIVKQGIFIDMRKPGALRTALQEADRQTFAKLGARGREIVLEHYDLTKLKQQYLSRYHAIAATPVELPTYSLKDRLRDNLANAGRKIADCLHGRAG